MKIVLMFLFVAFPVLGFILGEEEGLVFGVIADLFLLFLGVRIVKQNTVKLVEFLGKFNRILRPGFNVIIPFVEWTRDQDLYKKNFQVFVDGLTGDNVSVGIGLNVVYFVKKDDESIFQSIYEIDNPEKLIRATIDEQVRAMISTFTHKEIYTKRQEMGDAIEEALRIKLHQFGYTLDSIQVQDIQLDKLVLKALNRIVETEKMKEAALNEAEAARITMVKEAEADKESKKLLGEGMAEQRMAISQGFKASIDEIRSSDASLTGSDILKFLLDSARIETLEKVGKNNAKVIYLNENLEASGSESLKGSRVEKFLADK